MVSGKGMVRWGAGLSVAMACQAPRTGSRAGFGSRNREVLTVVPNGYIGIRVLI